MASDVAMPRGRIAVMEMIEVDHVGDVAVVRLKRGITNPLNLDLVTELRDSISRARQSPDIRAVVLTSANEKFFSIGFDIPELFALGRRDFGVFYRTFNQTCLELYTLPLPTVAALPGHAIAGGYIIALCCDYRIIAKGHKLVGVNEIKLGVPVPYVADCILRNMVGWLNARDIMMDGDFYPPDRAESLGLVDETVPLDQTVDEAIEKANALARFPNDAAAIIKRNRVEPVEAEIRSRLEEKESLFMDCWFSDEARDRLRAAMEKF
jgi:enoyl-CoA hydratase/carnithine racemase